MSFDLGVWYVSFAMSQAQAEAYYQHLNQDWVVVERKPQFDVFLKELTDRFPDLRSPSVPAPSPDEVPDALLMTAEDLRASPPPTQQQWDEINKRKPVPDNSPWAVGLGPTGTAISLSLIWSRVEQTTPAIYTLAQRHGLTVYDPQENTVTVPAQLSGHADPDALKVHLVLRIAGKPPALDVRLALDGALVSEMSSVSRQEAHAVARKVALEHKLAFYQVDDPACLMQAMQFVPKSSQDLPTGFAKSLESSGVTLMKMVIPGINK